MQTCLFSRPMGALEGARPSRATKLLACARLALNGSACWHLHCKGLLALAAGLQASHRTFVAMRPPHTRRTSPRRAPPHPHTHCHTCSDSPSHLHSHHTRARRLGSLLAAGGRARARVLASGIAVLRIVDRCWQPVLLYTPLTWTQGGSRLSRGHPALGKRRRDETVQKIVMPGTREEVPLQNHHS